MARIYGFRTTHGVDQNAIYCSVSNLFMPCTHKYFLYSSMKGPNINCTGVTIGEKDESKELFKEYHQFFSRMNLENMYKARKSEERYDYLMNIYH